jgi:NAD(P)-dependent dehydrogenase (short-subunit alcohol dehydrogenase family)
MGRTRVDLQETAKQVKDLNGEILSHRGDVAREKDVRRVLRKTLKRFSRMDILVNNAAVIGPPRFLEDADTASWRKTIGVNLHGPFFCCRAVIPVMRENRAGKIINIVSGLGQMPFPRFCTYAVTKAGIIQLTRSLSSELSSFKIRINAVDPGLMDTGMQENLRELGPDVLGEEVHEKIAEYRGQGRLRDPAEIAELILFLASPEADALSGHIGSLEDYEELGWHPAGRPAGKKDLAQVL